MSNLLVLLIIVVGGKIFLTRTLIGKTLLLVIKDIYYLIGLSVRMIKYCVRKVYWLSYKGYKFLKGAYDKNRIGNKDNRNTEAKKVVNGNIIYLQDYLKNYKK